MLFRLYYLLQHKLRVKKKHAMVIIAVKILRFVQLHGFFFKYIALISMTSVVLKQEIKKSKTVIVMEWMEYQLPLFCIVIEKFKLYGSVFMKQRHKKQYQHRISNNLKFDIVHWIHTSLTALKNENNEFANKLTSSKLIIFKDN
jgi:hypothetical protein